MPTRAFQEWPLNDGPESVGGADEIVRAVADYGLAYLLSFADSRLLLEALRALTDETARLRTLLLLEVLGQADEHRALSREVEREFTPSSTLPHFREAFLAVRS